MNKLKDADITTVQLNVYDLEAMSAFYRQVLKLTQIKSLHDQVILGVSNRPIITLLRRGDLVRPFRSQAGLYHIAILYPTRAQLAAVMLNVLTNAASLYTGSADHLVSEAFYLNDPEGNGIELYYDRERSVWEWEAGQVKMDSRPLDVAEYINTHRNEDSMAYDPRLGHVHLKVGDIGEAKKFYSDVLGFAVTAQLPGALFVSAGGYHHHVGLNTWESGGASRRGETLGLHTLEIVLPHRGDVDNVKKRLDQAGTHYSYHRNVLSLEDPWGTRIYIK